MPTNRLGPTRRSSAVAIVASRQAVPEALSQFNSRKARTATASQRQAVSRDQVVQTGHHQALGQRPCPRHDRQPVGHQHVANRLIVGLIPRLAPYQHKDHEHQIRQPRERRALLSCTSEEQIVASLSPSRRMMLFGFHSLSTNDHHDDAGERAHDVGQLRTEVARDVALHAGKRHAARDDRRQHLERTLPARPSRRSDSRE